jgi:hypothetical protein
MKSNVNIVKEVNNIKTVKIFHLGKDVESTILQCIKLNNLPRTYIKFDPTGPPFTMVTMQTFAPWTRLILAQPTK